MLGNCKYFPNAQYKRDRGAARIHYKLRQPITARLEQAITSAIQQNHASSSVKVPAPSRVLRGGLLQHAEQFFDDILAADEVDALQALIRQVACVAGLPKGDQQRWRAEKLLQRRRHLLTEHW